LESDEADHDVAAAGAKAAVSEDEAADVPAGIFAFPANAQTGHCLHKILEQFDFAAADEAAVKSLVRQQLEAFNLYDEERARVVMDMLERLRHIPLDPMDPSFTLAGVPTSERLTEMEFHFPTGSLDGARILQLIREPDSSSPAPAPVPISRIQGFLKGFVDLIFRFQGRYHIIDWKSNLLGTNVEDYNSQAMQREIKDACYDLQYHIYAVALDKYLRKRVAGYDYDQHFGGVHYVFLRGLAPGRPDLGVFHDRPSSQKIGRLSSVLGAAAEVSHD
jgi:exodeoxyribonuclease V beta subunit